MKDGYSQLVEAVARAGKRGESQNAFARRHGIDPGMLSRLCAGEILPNLRVALALHPTVSIFSWTEAVNKRHGKAA